MTLALAFETILKPQPLLTFLLLGYANLCEELITMYCENLICYFILLGFTERTLIWLLL